MADLALVTANTLNKDLTDKVSDLTLKASVDLTAGWAVYIDANGKWAKADATGAAGAANQRLWGVVLKTVKAGVPVTAVRKGALDGYDVSGLAFNAKIYLSDTAGALADAA